MGYMACLLICNSTTHQLKATPNTITHQPSLATPGKPMPKTNNGQFTPAAPPPLLPNYTQGDLKELSKM